MAVRTIKNRSITVDGYTYRLVIGQGEARYRGELEGLKYYFKIFIPVDKRKSRFAWLICTEEALNSDERHPADDGPHHAPDSPGHIRWRTWRGRKTK